MNLTIVKDKDRSAFTMRHFRNPLFDNNVFSVADKILIDYSGGYWEYIEADDNIAFMRLGDPDNQTLRNPFSGAKVITNSTLAGMIVTSYALLRQVEKKPSDVLIEKLTKLNRAISAYCNELNQMQVWMTMMD